MKKQLRFLNTIKNTLEYIRYKQSESHSNGPNYNDIELKTKS